MSYVQYLQWSAQMHHMVTFRNPAQSSKRLLLKTQSVLLQISDRRNHCNTAIKNSYCLNAQRDCRNRNKCNDSNVLSLINKAIVTKTILRKKFIIENPIPVSEERPLIKTESGSTPTPELTHRPMLAPKGKPQLLRVYS